MRTTARRITGPSLAGVGIDVGTTETKLAVRVDGDVLVEHRVPTPPVEERAGALVFNPAEIWHIVRRLLSDAASAISGRRCHVRVGIACQAPSLCAWRDDSAIGVSYLSSYGDPAQNSVQHRKRKAAARLAALLDLAKPDQRMHVSGLTGYLVQRLTGETTIDAVTAWELGIESPLDLERLFSGGASEIPRPVSPVRHVGHAEIGGGLIADVVAGTTDSAVLPLLFFPQVPDYYVYLGTWGCVLQSQIAARRDYERQWWSGELHHWLLSVPDFVHKSAGAGLRAFFFDLEQLLPQGKQLAICGGVVRSRSDEAIRLARELLPSHETLFRPEASTATGAAILAEVGA